MNEVRDVVPRPNMSVLTLTAITRSNVSIACSWLSASTSPRSIAAPSRLRFAALEIFAQRQLQPVLPPISARRANSRHSVLAATQCQS